MFDQLSVEIVPSLIKGVTTTTPTTKQNVDPAVHVCVLAGKKIADRLLICFAHGRKMGGGGPGPVGLSRGGGRSDHPKARGFFDLISIQNYENCVIFLPASSKSSKGLLFTLLLLFFLFFLFLLG
jgi:hypothetical protein